jgi:signal transduction histidine kinase
VHGFGLGLATVHTLVQQNGGQISVTSVPGQGTTFCLMFPELAGPGHALLS